MIRERGFDSQELQGYMNAGVPLSKERMGNTREDGSADQRSRAHLVLPKLLPDAFLLQGPTNRKFMQKAESLERRRGMNQRSVNVSIELISLSFSLFIYIIEASRK